MAKQAWDKYNGAKVATNKATVEEAESKTGFTSSRAGYHSLKDGKNIIRLAPPHDDNNPALEPICKAWLPREVEDKNKEGAKIIRNYPIFNARVHSPLERDIVDFYCEFVSKLMYKEHSKDEAKKRLAPINGYRSKDGKWVSGIRANLSYDAYAWIDGKFGRINFNKTICDRMNDLSISEEADEAIAIDPFSHPTKGRSLIIVYNSKADSKDKYQVSKGDEPRPLNDDQFEEFDKAEPLANMLRNAYTRADFDNALLGLQMFDEKNGYGVFNMEDFISGVEEIKDEVYSCSDIRESNKSEEEVEEGSTGAPVKEVTVKSTVKKVTNKVTISNDEGSHTEAIHADAEEQKSALTQESEDGFEDLEIEDLMAINDEKELGVVIKPSYPKTKVIRDIRAAIKAKESGGATPPFVADSKKSGLSGKDRLAKLKNK